MPSSRLIFRNFLRYEKVKLQKTVACGGGDSMADYINLSIFSQANIHIKPINMDDEQLAEFQSYISEFVTKRAQFFLHPEVEIDVALKEGSLKSYATVLGTVASLLYGGIANYEDFRKGVNLLYEDSKRLA